ncbi:MAG: ParB N-terminal domain-containing protein [Novosphingobium sp.]
MLDTAKLTIEDNAPPAEIGEVSFTPIPLSQLMLSNLNVRQTERDADIESLAEDIAARGLKQNLVVVPAHFTTGVAEADWAGKFEVVAGGRRYQALRFLAEAGRIAADHPVICKVEDRDEARETSLSENLHKVSMNPADEFDAFALIVRQAGGLKDTRPLDHTAAVAYCAKRFGVTVKHVEGRLRLADLAPEILEALRTGGINLESAKAYAGVPDHKLQLKVFKEQGKSSWKTHDPRAVRDALRGKTCPTTDPRVIYVGQQAYLDADGRIEAEMFMGANGVERITNVALLDKLVKAKAEEALPAIAKAEGWKEVRFATRGAYDANFPKEPAGFTKPYEYGKTAADISKAERKKSIGVYMISQDGDGLTYAGRFKPAGQDEPQRAGYVAPTPEERAESERNDEIETIACRLAVGQFAGTPFEGRAFWPRSTRWVDAIDAINDDEVLVAVLVKVTSDQIEAQRAEAATRYDARLAEQAEAAEATVEGDIESEDDEADELAS